MISTRLTYESFFEEGVLDRLEDDFFSATRTDFGV
jgi:hypothetical protein